MTINAPKVSIIMPVFNNAAFLAHAITSVQKQTLTDWELVIVDDCSTDGSKQMAEGFAVHDERIVVLQTPYNSGGPAHPRNMALETTKAPFIAFIDSDDAWHTKKLELQINFMKQKNSAITQTGYQCINTEGKKTDKAHRPIPVIDLEHLLKRRPLIGMSVMIDTGKTGKFRFDEKAPVEDFDLFLRLLKRHKIEGIDEALYFYRRGHQSLSSSKPQQIFNLLSSSAYSRYELGALRAATSLVSYCTGFISRRIIQPLL